MSSLAKYNKLNGDLDVLFDSFHDAFWSDPYFQFTRNWKPTDVTETETNYVVEVELPRFKREEIKVEAVKGTVQVTAKNARSSYVRSFSLQYADYDKAEVKLENGLLTVTVPKKTEAQAKVLEIK